MDEENSSNLIFDDNLAEKVIKRYKNKSSAVILDYSPSNGRIIRIDQLIRFRMITELSLIGHSIKDISNISVLINLTKLNLSWNNISSILPLMKLTKLEILHIGHNDIIQIPKSISSLSNLKSLQLSNNPISDRNIFLSLRQNYNLTCFDFEATPVSCEPDSIIFCIYLLPQLTIINRTQIEPRMRREAHRRYGKAEIDELSDMNISLAKENKKYKKIVNLIMQNNIQNPEGIVDEINKLKSEKVKLIEYIKNQDQIIDQLQQKIKENSLNKGYKNSKSDNNSDSNNENLDSNNPLGVVVKDLQNKVYHLQDQLATKTKENKMLSYQITENESLLTEYEQIKSKTIQYKEKLDKLTKDNQLLQSTNVKLYDQIGSLKQEQSYHQSQQSKNQNLNNDTIQQEYQNKINDLIKDYSQVKDSLLQTQEQNSKLTKKYNNDLDEKENTIKILKEQISQQNNIIAELKSTTAQLTSQVDHFTNEERNHMPESQSLFQPLMKEVEKQRDFYQFDQNNDISRSCSFEEQTYLLCTQTFKQIQIQYNNIKEKLGSAKNKNKNLEQTINKLNEEQKTNNEQILSLKSNLESTNHELTETKEKLTDSVQKSDFLRIKAEYDRAIAENEKNSITLKKVVSQLSQQKRAKNDLIQTKTATEEENNELMNRIETLSSEVKQKRDKVDEYRFQCSKYERKVLQLKEIINKLTIERNQLNAQIEQFTIFREEVTTTIARMEEQQNATETKYQEKLRMSEEEKNALQQKIQQLSLKITELNQQNSSYYDAKKENDYKIKQKEKEFIEIESQNETLKNQLQKLNETFVKQKQNDKNNIDALQSQIEDLQRESMKSAANSKKEISDIQISLEESLKREKKLQKKLSKLTDFITNLQNEHQQALIDIDELKNLIDNYVAREKEANIRELRLKETVNTNEHLFKTVTQKYQELQKVNEELMEQIEGNEAEKLKYKMTISQLKDQIKELQEEVQQDNQEKEDLDSKLLEKIQELSMTNAQLDEAKAKLNTRDDNESKVRQQNLDLQNQVTETLIENDNLKKRIANLEQSSVSSDVYQSIVDKSKEVANKLDELNSINDENTKMIENLNAEKMSLNQEIANLQKKNQDILSQIQSNEDLNNKTNLIQQKTIDSLKQQLSESKNLIEQLKDKEQANEKQKSNELSQMKAELTQLMTNYGVTKDDLQAKEKENFQLKEENQSLKQANDDLQNKFNQSNSKLAVLSQKFNDEMNKHEDENDDKNRQIGLAKKQIKNLESENMSLQDQIHQLLIENKSKVPQEKFNDLQQKYSSLKKLHEFESSKNQSNIIQKDDQIERLRNDLAEKEEKFNDEIEKTSRDLNDKKELIKRLQKQIQMDNQKIDELTPLISTKSELEECQNELQLKNKELERLNSKLSDLNSNYHKSNSLLNENQRKTDRLISSLNQIPLIFNTTGTNSSKLDAVVKKLNPVLKSLSIEEIPFSFKQKLRLVSKSVANIQSCEETLLQKHQNLLQRVTQILMSLPIGKPSFNIQSNDQLENQLEKLQKLVGLVKDIFDEREKNIENLAAMVDSQHQAVIKIAEVPTDTSTVALSFQNYQKSQQIIKEDRSRRSMMPLSKPSPRKA